MKRFKWLPLLAAVGLLATACGGGSNKTVAGKVTIVNESGSTWTCQFNPFNTAVTFNLTANGFIYEPLAFVNILKNGSATPWLATGYQWSNGFKTLTFTIRKGAKWSDGKPFTAKDVAYTFNAIKNKAID